MLLLILVQLIISNALTYFKDRSIYYSRFLMLSLLQIIFLIIINKNIIVLSKNIGFFCNTYFYNFNLYIFTIFIIIILFLILNLNSFYPRKLNIKSYLTFLFNVNFYFKYSKSNILKKVWNQFNILEYSLILLFTIIGSILLMYSNDLISIFLSLELQSYGLYIISTIYKNSELSTFSGLSYFLLGGLSSCIILLGQSLIYINTGNTSLDYIYILYNINNEIYNKYFENSYNFLDYIYMIKNLEYNPYETYWYNIEYNMQYFFIIITIGFLFKISAAPFHFWAPDVYDGVPTIVTTFIAIIPKISILIFLSDIIRYTSLSFLEINWINNLLISSILSLIIGSVLGLIQIRIKKLYAYSTISNIGFILLSLTINTTESIKSFIFYLIQYSIINLNTFIILYSIGFLINIKNENLIEKYNSPIQYIHQLKGFFYINPILSISFCISLFSFIGIPPLIGFYGKQMILSAALDNKNFFIVFLAILTSVISAIYYLSIIKEKFFYKPKYIIIYKNIKQGFNLTDILNSMYIFINYIMYQNKSLNNVKSLNIKYKNFNFTLSSSLSFIISIISLFSIFYIFIHERFIILINILSIPYIY